MTKDEYRRSNHTNTCAENSIVKQIDSEQEIEDKSPRPQLNKKGITNIAGKLNLELQKKKNDVVQTIYKIDIEKKKLQTVHAKVAAQQAALRLCQREIKHHCCICGGTHVSIAHHPSTQPECTTMKKKNKSLVYLKRALKASIAEEMQCIHSLDQSFMVNDSTKQTMSDTLKCGIQLMESLAS